MKRIITLFLSMIILIGYSLIAMGSESADFLPFLDSAIEKNDGGNGSSDEKTEKIEKRVMPNVVGMLADEAQTTLKKAGIKVTWEYKQSYIKDTSHDAYIIQKYGSQTGNAPPNSYLKYWKVKKQSVNAGKEETESVILTVDLNVADASRVESFSTGSLVVFTGTIIHASWNVSTGLLGQVIFKSKISTTSDSEEKYVSFWAKDGPAVRHIENGATFRVVGEITKVIPYDGDDYGDDIWINALGMDYKGRN